MASSKKEKTDVSLKIDTYIAQHEKWHDVLQELRNLLSDTELEESVKWGMPTYLIDNKIVVSIAAFKNHCAVWFHQGVFLKDREKRLVNAQEGTTKGMRHWRFDDAKLTDTKLLVSYINESIANQKAGKVIKPQKKSMEMPQELGDCLVSNKALAKKFDELTPGKQREYAKYIGDAKQEKTRLTRIEKITPLIMAGAGLNDKYRNC